MLGCRGLLTPRPAGTSACREQARAPGSAGRSGEQRPEPDGAGRAESQPSRPPHRLHSASLCSALKVAFSFSVNSTWHSDPCGDNLLLTKSILSVPKLQFGKASDEPCCLIRASKNQR